VFAVPRSIPMSLDKKPKSPLNMNLFFQSARKR
jgi:hypothetical protein